MNKEEFEQERLNWIKDWHSNYRFLDIDFEMYMLMKGITPEEYKKLNDESKLFGYLE
jgi:hypothetical protein